MPKTDGNTKDNPGSPTPEGPGDFETSRIGLIRESNIRSRKRSKPVPVPGLEGMEHSAPEKPGTARIVAEVATYAGVSVLVALCFRYTESGRRLLEFMAVSPSFLLASSACLLGMVIIPIGFATIVERTGMENRRLLSISRKIKALYRRYSVFFIFLTAVLVLLTAYSIYAVVVVPERTSPITTQPQPYDIPDDNKPITATGEEWEPSGHARQEQPAAPGDEPASHPEINPSTGKKWHPPGTFTKKNPAEPATPESDSGKYTKGEGREWKPPGTYTSKIKKPTGPTQFIPPTQGPAPFLYNFGPDD